MKSLGNIVWFLYLSPIPLLVLSLRVEFFVAAVWPFAARRGWDGMGRGAGHGGDVVADRRE